MTAIVTDNMDEENNALVSKIPVGVSGTALAASLLRDGWSVSYLHFTFNP
jgi:nucleoprotein TPR